MKKRKNRLASYKYEERGIVKVAEAAATIIFLFFVFYVAIAIGSFLQMINGETYYSPFWHGPIARVLEILETLFS